MNQNIINSSTCKKGLTLGANSILLAVKSFESLNEKLQTLPDDVTAEDCLRAANAYLLTQTQRYPQTHNSVSPLKDLWPWPTLPINTYDDRLEDYGRAVVLISLAIDRIDRLEKTRHEPDDPSDALLLIIKERVRQIEQECWYATHDDSFKHEELVKAAKVYLTNPQERVASNGRFAPNGWPWPEWWYKPTTRQRDLEKSAALLLAEIDRVLRSRKNASM